METNYNLVFKILGYIVPILYGFFKLLTRHIMKEIDKKVDLTLYKKEMEFMEKQNNLNNKVFAEKLTEIKNALKEVNSTMLEFLKKNNI